jgi:hypothetical protein
MTTFFGNNLVHSDLEQQIPPNKTPGKTHPDRMNQQVQRAVAIKIFISL